MSFVIPRVAPESNVNVVADVALPISVVPNFSPAAAVPPPLVLN